MILNNDIYYGLSDGLAQLSVPDQFRIGRRRYPVPQTVDDFTGAICYGQRLFFNREEKNDYGVILRVIEGYYYSIVTGEKWDEDNALVFGKNIITCAVCELYPVAMHLTKLIFAMVERERDLLHRQPSKTELAAGIEKLNLFTDLIAIDFLRDAMKITVEEVMQTSYKECLVRFMLAKEIEDYRLRYVEMLDVEAKQKTKHK